MLFVAVSKEHQKNPMSPRRRRATYCESQVPEHQETSRAKFVCPMSQARRSQPRHGVTDCKIPELFSPFDEGRPLWRNLGVVVGQLAVEPKEKNT